MLGNPGLLETKMDVTKTSFPHDEEVPQNMRAGVLIALFLTFIGATAGTYIGALQVFEGQAASFARSQHALYLRSLNEAVGQHQHLPFVIAQNPVIADRMATGDTDRLNEMLRSFAEAAELEAIYVMGLDGRVVAASNHAEPTTFVGQNYGFRPYFQGALRGEHSDYFAIGATTGRPGYFVAEPLRDEEGGLIGVIAIKLDVSELQQSWEERGEYVLATNSDGIVVLASNPAWLYRTISEPGDERRSEIKESRQFGAEPLTPMDWVAKSDGRILLLGEIFVGTSGNTDLLRWTVHYLTPESMVLRQTLIATGVLGALIAVLIGFAAFIRSRRIEAALALSQRHRKELLAANEQLVNAQDELARNSKLAALGHLAASVTHELGQPISALKSHLFAAEIGNEITSQETLGSLHRLVDRMERITKQLRFFARRSDDEFTSMDIGTVVSEAIALMQHDFDAAEAKVRWIPPEVPCRVTGNQLQLEQVMVNLLRNALDASLGEDQAEITLHCRRAKGDVIIAVADGGRGLGGRTIETLQEPFFTTRSSGDGMGLGLAITAEIIRAHGGSLSARDGTERGAVFEITLPETREGTE